MDKYTADKVVESMTRVREGLDRACLDLDRARSCMVDAAVYDDTIDHLKSIRDEAMRMVDVALRRFGKEEKLFADVDEGKDVVEDIPAVWGYSPTCDLAWKTHRGRLRLAQRFTCMFEGSGDMWKVVPGDIEEATT